MHMKKMLAILAVLVLVLSACSSSKSESGSSGGSSSGSSSSSGGSASEPSGESAGGSGESSEPLKVVLLVPGNLGDKSFLDSANRGVELIKSELGAETKVIEMGTDQTKWQPFYEDVANQDWDIIIGGNTTSAEYFYAVAEQHPDKKFIDFDTEFTEFPDNVYALSYKINDATFLAGASAALVSKSGIIGFIGGLDVPGINTFLVGYIEGAKYVNPDIKVITSYAGTFTDPAKGKELALVQYNAGADVIFGAAGGTGLGIFDAAKEKGKYAIGVDSDQATILNDTDPEKAKLTITSAMKNIDQALLRAVKLYQEGKLQFGAVEQLGFSEGGVGIAKNEFYDAIMTDEMKATINDLEAKLLSGEIVVSNAMGMETSEVEAIRNSVAP
jgi:basic membrane protein A